MTLPIGRLNALVRQYMHEQVTISRVSARGANAAFSPVVTNAPAYRLFSSAGYFVSPGGADAIGVLKFVVDTQTDIRAKDILTDGAGMQYRVTRAHRTLPGLCVELEATAVA